MPEPESALLIENLRRANRGWKTAAISLAMILGMLVVNNVWRARLAIQRAEAEAYRAVAAEHKARHELGKRLENVRQEEEKARRQ